ncbi:MAG: class I SAM-dependent methyltransferase [Planctomycetota bacterium]|nr:class I SAM-dependent methyltransferase [Planctomycetota bacterium]
MNLRQLSRTWDELGQRDPLWAILSHDDKRDNRWDLHEFLQTGRTEIEEALACVTRFQPDLPRRNALDFGCGVGRLSQALAEHFEKVDGIDIAESMIGQARTINRHGAACSYHHNTAPDLRMFPAQSFDFLYSNLTLQHMPPELGHSYIRELCRLLRTGGALVFEIPIRPRRDRSRLGVLLSKVIRSAQLLWLRSVRGQPVMDMFGTPPERVRKLVVESSCRLVDISESGSAGPDWVCQRYCVVR